MEIPRYSMAHCNLHSSPIRTILALLNSLNSALTTKKKSFVQDTLCRIRGQGEDETCWTGTRHTNPTLVDASRTPEPRNQHNQKRSTILTTRLIKYMRIVSNLFILSKSIFPIFRELIASLLVEKELFKNKANFLLQARKHAKRLTPELLEIQTPTSDLAIINTR